MKFLESQGHKYQNGQGLVGFVVVVVLVLVPLILGVSYVSRIGDANHKAIEASRYATWERTVWGDGSGRYHSKSNDEISFEITQRVFAQGGLPIDSVNDLQQKQVDQVTLDPYLRAWNNLSGPRPKILIVDPANPNHFTNLNQGVGGAGGTGLTSAISRLTNYDEDTGLYKSTIKVSLFKKESWWREWNLLLGDARNDFFLEKNNAMLVGSWNAIDPDEVKSRVGRLTLGASPSTRILGQTISTISSIPGVSWMIPEFNELEIGKIDPEVIPCQRTNQSGGDCVDSF